MPNSTQVFADFDDDLDALIATLPAGWADNSWRNDTCPCLINEEFASLSCDARIWIDYKDPALRENPKVTRFQISTSGYGDIFLLTDDWADVVKAVNSEAFRAWWLTVNNPEKRS